jgi:cytochrome c oxidase assembly protein subunit 15
MTVVAPARARVLAWLGSPRVLRELALASVVANVVIVVTGGAVRLTGSGLGCPTWPRCTGSSLTPTRAHSFHGIIEFTNRQLTFVLGVIAVVTLLAAYRQRRELRLAGLAFLGIPAQAVLGGITVLTDLNPWTVAAHFLLSMSIIAVTTLLWWRLRFTSGPGFAPAAVLARLIVLAAGVVLALGTVVTGTGPHAGDKGARHRIGLDPSGVAQLHADAVMVLVGLTVGLLVLLRVMAASGAARRAGWWLIGIELSQGVVGYVQYFTHLPAGLVAVHMLGACLVWIAALRVLLTVQPTDRSVPAAPRSVT